jgi:hypothetical protein
MCDNSVIILCCTLSHLTSSFALSSVSCVLEVGNDDEAHIHCLHVPPPIRPSAHAAVTSLANGDCEVPIPRDTPLLLFQVVG